MATGAEPVKLPGWGLFARRFPLVSSIEPELRLAPVAHPLPVADGRRPPYTRRMVAIAGLLVDGATDREIARELGVCERTVSADVRAMSQRLGARSRAHAIALISGVEG